MSKFKRFLNKYILPRLSDNKFFIDKNGKPSSKRLGGLALIFTGVIAALLNGMHWFTLDTPLILGILTIGAGLLGMPKDQQI